MSRIIPTPFSANAEDAQFMEHYEELGTPVQHIVIVVVFLAILAGIVILRDMLKTVEETHQVEA